MPRRSVVKLGLLCRELVSRPPRDVVRKGAWWLRRSLSSTLQHRKDRRSPSYSAVEPSGASSLCCYFTGPSADELRDDLEVIAQITRLHCGHCFDLLGSGWVHVRHGTTCAGLEGWRYEAGEGVAKDHRGEWLRGRVSDANLEQSRRIWQLVDPEYVPIDWHRDLKSGYRWPERAWYRDIRVDELPGADLKVPLELARMHHLALLACAYALACDGAPGLAPADVYQREFRNEILDFAATNPPRFGVNWWCTMDVAIRVANWLVAYDFFRSYGAAFDRDFDQTLLASVHDHARHIAENLEWDPTLRNNHYLADVVGLLFAAAHLPASQRANDWLSFAVEQLLAEVALQFGEDGSNFEGSTCYHRLSAEMVVYASALVLALPPGRSPSGRAFEFPRGYAQRLERMAEFTIDCSKQGGRIAQIGDNDSGRFLKVRPAYIREPAEGDAFRWREDHLDHRHLVAAVGGLVPRADFARLGAGSWEGKVIARVLRGAPLGVASASSVRSAAASRRVGTQADWTRAVRASEAATGSKRRTTCLESTGGSLREGLEILGYPNFGLWLFRSRRLFLAVRCGRLGQNGRGGHSHNDQLAVEIAIDGVDRVADPGSYLYTPLPARRNEYRSVKAHFAPCVEGREPSRLDVGLFRLGGDPRGRVLYFGDEGFVGQHEGFGALVHRRVAIGEGAVMVVDWSTLDLAAPAAPPPFSRGYGLRSDVA
ncbi:MAG: heparinase II/III family protein [Candidatus Binatia bacterium]